MPHKPVPSPEVFAHKDIREKIGKLPEAHPYRRMVAGMREKLLEDKYAGEKVPRDLWPGKYRDQGLPNLYRYELPGGYRACYSVVAVEGRGGCPFIHGVLTHSEYDELFGYKNN
jgi:hypothetical protein